jgi:hypothetical protein
MRELRAGRAGLWAEPRMRDAVRSGELRGLLRDLDVVPGWLLEHAMRFGRRRVR